MKVVLTAFRGRLRSDVMEWPENVPDRITMEFPYESLGLNIGSVSFKPGVPDRHCYADFVNTGRGLQCGKDIAYEFVLVDLQPPRREDTE